MSKLGTIISMRSTNPANQGGGQELWSNVGPAILPGALPYVLCDGETITLPGAIAFTVKAGDQYYLDVYNTYQNPSHFVAHLVVGQEKELTTTDDAGHAAEEYTFYNVPGALTA